MSATNTDLGDASSARPYTSVFDSYPRGIRGSNLVEGTQVLINSWSDCDYILRYSAICIYIITVLAVILMLSIFFKFPAIVLALTVTLLTLISIYASLLVSKKSCFEAIGMRS